MAELQQYQLTPAAQRMLGLTAVRPDAADQAGTRTHTVLASLEALIQERGENREDVAVRRRLASELAVKLGNRAPAPDEIELCISAVAPSGRYNAADPFDAALFKMAEAHQLDLDDPLQLADASRRVAREHPEALPLIGPAAIRAEHFGGRERYEQLLHFAEEHHLDLDRAADLERAQRECFWKHANVWNARDFDEAVDAVMAESGVRLTDRRDPEQLRTASLAVLKRRPDLVPAYGGPREEPAPMVVRPLLATEERNLRFEELRDAELLKRGIPKPVNGSVPEPFRQAFREAIEFVISHHPEVLPAGRAAALA